MSTFVNFNFNFDRATDLIILVKTELNCLVRRSYIWDLKIQRLAFNSIKNQIRIPNFKLDSI